MTGRFAHASGLAWDGDETHVILAHLPTGPATELDGPLALLWAAYQDTNDSQVAIASVVERYLSPPEDAPALLRLWTAKLEEQGWLVSLPNPSEARNGRTS